MEDRYYWAALLLGAAMLVAFVGWVRDPWLLLAGTVLALYGASHGTLRSIRANKDGVSADWQLEAIREKLRRSGSESLTTSDVAEATVTRPGAPLTPDEFLDVLDAVSVKATTARATATAHDATVQVDHENKGGNR